MVLSATGLAILFAVFVYESFFHSSHLLQHSAECLKCTQGSTKDYFTLTTFANILGGFFMASAHVRNYRLCRSTDCTHDSSNIEH